MSYVLGISFEYNRYHRDAIFRVYADEKLIDEIQLCDNIGLKTFNLDNLPYPIADKKSNTNQSSIVILPEKFFLFEINEKSLQDNIKIEIENNNNNHTNGFMTKFSFVRFHEIFLMHSSLLDYNNWSKMILSRREPFYDGTDLQKNNYYPKAFHDDSFDNNVIVEKSTNEWSGPIRGTPRGGSFRIRFPLYKKHKVIHLGQFLPGKQLVINHDPAKILWLFNALNNVNENQRSNIT